VAFSVYSNCSMSSSQFIKFVHIPFSFSTKQVFSVYIHMCIILSLTIGSRKILNRAVVHVVYRLIHNFNNTKLLCILLFIIISNFCITKATEYVLVQLCVLVEDVISSY
jgi:hypothetical protein